MQAEKTEPTTTLAQQIAKKVAMEKKAGATDEASEEMGAELIEAFKGGDAKRLMKILDSVIRAKRAAD